MGMEIKKIENIWIKRSIHRFDLVDSHILHVNVLLSNGIRYAIFFEKPEGNMLPIIKKINVLTAYLLPKGASIKEHFDMVNKYRLSEDIQLKIEQQLLSHKNIRMKAFFLPQTIENKKDFL
jgi:hypothetical protein